ncbi:MAG TPA: FmdB family zinc ribbon protein [Pyrinomonadaceae bacterium]|jgi:putative FmdB family regulatory protein
MPIYEYKCLDCGAHVEKMQKISDAPLTVCESCGGKMKKQLSLSGFQFKGEGWYVTDYSDKTKKKNPEKSEKTSAPESTAKKDDASKKSNDAASDSKKETVSKKE